MRRSIVWITGSSSGIGRALAHTCPWDDALVVGASRQRESLDVPRYEHIATDLATPQGWQELASSFDSHVNRQPKTDRVAFFHCAATIEPMKFVGEADSEQYQRSVLLNSVAPQVLGRAFIDAMGMLPPGVPQFIVMFTTGSSSGVYPGWASYKAGKAAVDEWVRNAAAEYASKRPSLRIMAIAPGAVATHMQELIRGTSVEDFPRRSKFAELHERGELREPTDVAREIWSLLDQPPDEPVFDLRTL